ncbi:hypothetical protein NQ314_003075 [Rhamnusium bicolor]|uniref:Dihydroorotate dehydrogenase (quinone), mitochondrial n=1 Tax=Rhamnusium bicolor TaxID=1586634 RepID=A0AAV8ZQK4_9CUCU|nr:hypothetical protein NQ314_003075 [Rhamnusium bicolor]
MPIVHVLDAERAHNLAIFVSKYRLLPKSRYKDPDLLKIEIFGKEFSNPVGIAAGFDKDGKAILGLKDIGFGFVEVGSVTPEPQHGNEQPRVFRLLKDFAVINRYGFNSEGHNNVFKRIENVKQNTEESGIVGVNLGKNKTSPDPINDYVEGIQKFGRIADYLVINISSPNTPGLRNMQKKNTLKKLLCTLVETRNNLPINKKPPLLLKLAPDLSYEERQDIADVLNEKKCRVDGLIISVGGISSGKDAYEKIKAGASLVQLYTSLVYNGPPVVTKIKKELVQLLAKDGYSNISEAVGKGTK